MLPTGVHINIHESYKHETRPLISSQVNAPMTFAESKLKLKLDKHLKDTNALYQTDVDVIVLLFYFGDKNNWNLLMTEEKNRKQTWSDNYQTVLAK